MIDEEFIDDFFSDDDVEYDGGNVFMFNPFGQPFNKINVAENEDVVRFNMTPCYREGLSCANLGLLLYTSYLIHLNKDWHFIMNELEDVYDGEDNIKFQLLKFHTKGWINLPDEIKKPWVEEFAKLLPLIAEQLEKQIAEMEKQKEMDNE